MLALCSSSSSCPRVWRQASELIWSLETASRETGEARRTMRCFSLASDVHFSRFFVLTGLRSFFDS